MERGQPREAQHVMESGQTCEAQHVMERGGQTHEAQHVMENGDSRGTVCNKKKKKWTDSQGTV